MSTWIDATLSKWKDELDGNDMLGTIIQGDYIIILDRVTGKNIARVHFTDLEMATDD